MRDGGQSEDLLIRKLQQNKSHIETRQNMQLARVEGSMIATRKHPSLNGWRMLICQPLDADGKAEGTPIIAIDPHGAGMHQTVIVSSDGSAAREAVGDPSSPVRQIIVAIVDETTEERVA
jgi:microcompartment protein CcmK/EutM